MTLLKFFLDWGKNGLAFLWVPYIALSVWFLFQAFRTWKNSTTRITDAGGKRTEEINQPRMKWFELKPIWYFIGITIVAIIVMLAIHSDYK